MKSIRITVMKQAFHYDLMERYENHMENACAMKLGEAYLSVAATKPEGLCESAWQSMFPFVMGLACGAEDLYEGWMKNKTSAMISCNDGFRPVSFLLETVAENECGESSN